jgi:hypothetical protein
VLDKENDDWNLEQMPYGLPFQFYNGVLNQINKVMDFFSIYLSFVLYPSGKASVDSSLSR